MPKELNEKALSYLKQKPNRTFLLAIFNTFNTVHGKYKDSLKIRHGIGEEPVIYDTLLTSQSNTQLINFLKSKGYFDASSKFLTRIKNKRAYITYQVIPRIPYHVNTITDSISDTTLKRLFNEAKIRSNLKVGMIYDIDLLDAEQARINELYRENGYFKFSKQYVRFIVFDTLQTKQIGLELIVDNPDSSKHHKYYIDSVLLNVRADHTEETPIVSHDTINLKNNRFFYDPYKKFKPGIIHNTLYFNSGDIFRSSDQNISYRRFAQLGVFRQIKIDYKEYSRDSIYHLNPQIEVTQNKKLSISLSGEGSLNQDFFGLNSNLIYSDHNFFKGAELFEFKIGGVLNHNLAKQTNIYNRTEFNTQASIQFPFLVIPFYQPEMGKQGDLPHTKILLGYSYITQPTYNRREYLTSLSYQFQDTRAKIHTVTPIEISFLKAYLLPVIRSVFDSTGNQSRLQSFTSSIIAGSAYNYEQNGFLLKTQQNFIYFNGHLELVGNTLSLVDRYLTKKANQSNGQILGLPYYQFAKSELDFRWYKTVGANGILVFRLAPGLAYSYGKTDLLNSVPFDRQFFVGGPNSIRAWPARQLGPGAYLRKILIPTNSKGDTAALLSSQLRGLDQTGEVKLEGNVEFRFLLASDFFGRKLSAAAFADFGNIWLARFDHNRREADINSSTFLKQFALGSGAGLRYDLSFFIFRFDVGVKLYDPLFGDTNGWVIQKFGSTAFKEAYLNTYGGLNSHGQLLSSNLAYHFLTYNFGIGFPF